MKAQKVEFVFLSDIGLSDEGIQQVSESGYLTFGNAAHTLYTLDDVAASVQFDADEDRDTFAKVIDALGGQTLVDLEG